MKVDHGAKAVSNAVSHPHIKSELNKLSIGESPSFSLGPGRSEREKNEPRNILVDAAAIGDYTRVKAALESGAPVDGEDVSTGDTALIRASMGGHISTMSMLVDRGAVLEHETELGKTALIEAVCGGQEEVSTHPQILVNFFFLVSAFETLSQTRCGLSTPNSTLCSLI